jgi:Uma2 family endonuclease
MMDSEIMMSPTVPGVSLDKYLNTVYRPDRDYVDGRLEERNVGKWDHADLQAALTQFLRNNAKRFRVITVTEIRVCVAPARYRVADVCCVRRAPDESGIVTEPPVLVIEILSPDDTVPQTEDRIHDYLAMGVPCVWLIHPRRPDRAWIYEAGGRRDVRDGVLTAGEIRVSLAELPSLEDFE